MPDHQVRITLEQTLIESLVAMCDGNPGALSVCTQLLKEGEHIDPDNAFGGFGHILTLDMLGVYGPSIWMLYKDCCKQDLVSTVAVIRATQLGIVPASVVLSTIENRGKGLDVADTLARVRARLPLFRKADVVPPAEVAQ